MGKNLIPIYAVIAQLAERCFGKAEVVGAEPTFGSITDLGGQGSQ